MTRKTEQDRAGVTADKTEKAEVAVDVDRVVMPSVRADGTPDQSDGFAVIEA